MVAPLTFNPSSLVNPDAAKPTKKKRQTDDQQQPAAPVPNQFTGGSFPQPIGGQ
jgi:hypothetical protein